MIYVLFRVLSPTQSEPLVELILSVRDVIDIPLIIFHTCSVGVTLGDPTNKCSVYPCNVPVEIGIPTTINYCFLSALVVESRSVTVSRLLPFCDLCLWCPHRLVHLSLFTWHHAR